MKGRKEEEEEEDIPMEGTRAGLDIISYHMNLTMFTHTLGVLFTNATPTPKIPWKMPLSVLSHDRTRSFPNPG